MKSRILILCTGNSCRSQMAQAFLQSFNKELSVFSAGTFPASEVNPLAIEVMREVGLDISKNKTTNVDEYLNKSFDYVITVCDDARETCPVFVGRVSKRLHFGFEDPAKAKGNKENKLKIFRKIRDEIKKTFFDFYKNELAEQNE